MLERPLAKKMTRVMYDVMEKIQTGKNLAALSLNGELTVESLKEAITPKARR